MMKTIITLAAIFMITTCTGKHYPGPINSLPDTLQVGQSVLSRDSIGSENYPVLDEKQREGLARQMSLDVPDSIQLIGVRPAGSGIILDAYKVPLGEDPNHFKVYLVTHDSKGVVVDAIDLHEFHTSEHQGPMRFGGNRFYTTDAVVTFEGPNRFTLHRVMTLTSLYLKDHTLTEAWRVEWDNNYEIDGDGHFVFLGQHETNRTPADIDDPIITTYQSRDRE